MSMRVDSRGASILTSDLAGEEVPWILRVIRSGWIEPHPGYVIDVEVGRLLSGNHGSCTIGSSD